VAPGTYTATLSANGQEFSKSFHVRGDPAVETSQADYEARTEANLRGQEIESTLNRMIGSVVDLRTQAENLQETIRGKNLPNEDEITTQIQAVTGALDALENVLRRPPPSMGYRIYPRLSEQLSFATRGISQAQARPTDGQLQVMSEVEAEIQKAQSELQSIITGPIAALNRLLQGQGRILVGGGR
jgi:flagellar hook-basal body complex protein FliE